MERGDAISALADRARDLTFETIQGESHVAIYLPGFGSITVEETESSSLIVAIWVRSTSYDWPGERTDLNELFAVLTSLVLHAHGVSTQHIVVGHPVIDLPGEVYATYLVPRQPYPTGYPITDEGIAQVERVIVDVSLTARLVVLFLEVSGWERGKEGAATQTLSPSHAAWVSSLAEALGVEETEITFNVRRRPNWSYFSAGCGWSVFRSKDLSQALRVWFGRDMAVRYDGPTGCVFKRDGLLNLVRSADVATCRRILASVGDVSDAELLLLAVENRVLAIASEHAVIWSADATRSAAVEERDRIARRHASEHALLFETAKVRWSDRVAADRFEELVKLVLEHEPGVQRVRFAGATNEQDGGRDLLAEWDTPLLPSELDPDAPSSVYRTRRVVVQCKADAAAVGIRRVNGVGDTLEQYEADGYLLVVRSRLTRPLVDRLDQRRAAGRVWVEWWGADELERRLLAQRHISTAFGDVMTVEQ